jgi:conjugal transfer pilin signal peptidase TrbI
MAGFAVIALAWKGGEATLQRYEFGINVTPSLPHWAFVTDRQNRSVARGDLVQFVPPENRYYSSGQHFVKRVAGVAGDIVERRGDEMWVSGRNVGRIKPTDSQGRPVEAGPVGRIPDGHFFLVGDHPDSLDSRYAALGWIPASRLIGKAEPVL